MIGNKNNDIIYNTLKNDIILVKLKPGVLISETEVAQRFNVSRTPIRQVFSKLSEEGLVDIKPQKGSFVSLIDLKYVKDIIFMRLILENEIINHAIDKVTEDDINYLHHNLTKQKSILDHNLNAQDMLKEYNSLDNEFHGKLFVIADKINLWNVMHKLDAHYMRFRILDIFDKTVMEGLFQQHTEILKLIENKDKTNVRNVLEKHLTGGFERFSNIQNQYDSYFVNN